MESILPGSFRDPSGFLFKNEGILYRQINDSFQAQYTLLLESGLYDALVRRHWLVPHQEASPSLSPDGKAWKVIMPEKVDVISYPYEWSFSQLKDAALLTLDIQKLAMEKGMSLKDASAYNVQFHRGRPVFIDTLSFEAFHEGKPWVAYRQFCQHFLAPLALMARKDISLSKLLSSCIDGIPLPLASQLLPWKTRLNMGLGVHIHLHARAQAEHAGSKVSNQVAARPFSRHSFLALLESLRSTLKGLQWQPENTEWFDYYDSNNNYRDSALTAKDSIVDDYLSRCAGDIAWDLGANTGRFSRIAAKHNQTVCAWDIDPACVELNYLAIRKSKEKQVLPLLLDLANPSPAIGWANTERMSLVERGPVNVVLALGLVHHLAITNNVPLERVAGFLSEVARFLVVEFIPKEDSQVKKLLQNREDIFTTYTETGFETAFASHGFELMEKNLIPDSVRTLYLYRNTATPEGQG